MMPLPRFIRSLLNDPAPGFAFELSEEGIAVARTTSPPQLAYLALEPGVLSVSPVKDNVLRLEALTSQIQSAAGGPRRDRTKRQQAVLILPDCSVRVSVLDFDVFPSDIEQQLALIRFRIKKTLPFDVDSASLSYFPQPHANGDKKLDVVVAVAPLEIVARYEASFRGAGFQPGLVTTSTLASLALIRDGGLAVLVKVGGRMLTISVLNRGALKLLRSIELIDAGPAEVLGHLHPTFAYAEDQLAGRPDKVVLCGFGAQEEQISEEYRAELGVPVERLRSRFGAPGAHNAGLFGYLESLEEM